MAKTIFTDILSNVDSNELKTLSFTQEPIETLREEKSIIHYISTPTKDWGGDVVNQHGIDAEIFNKYRTVFYNHNYDQPIAKNLWSKADEKGYLAKTQFSKTNLFSDDIYNLYLEGIINTWSVGIQVSQNDARYDEVSKTLFIDKAKLLEYSSAPLAMNFDALDQAKSFVKSAVGNDILLKASTEINIKGFMESVQSDLNQLKKANEDLNELVKLNCNEDSLDELENKILELSAEIKELKAKLLEKKIEPDQPKKVEISEYDFNALAKKVAFGEVSRFKGKS